MSEPRWATVLFDFDGTLADTVPLIVASYRWTIENHDLPPADEATIRSWIGRTLPDMMTELAGPERATELAEAYSGWQVANVERLLRPFEGVNELVAELEASGVGVGIATARRRAGTEAMLRILGLDARLPVLAALEDTDTHKPDPAPLLLATQRLGADPAATAYVGDTVLDLRAADAAGMAGIGVTWGAGTRDDLGAEPHVALADTTSALRDLLLGS